MFYEELTGRLYRWISPREELTLQNIYWRLCIMILPRLKTVKDLEPYLILQLIPNDKMPLAKSTVKVDKNMYVFESWICPLLHINKVISLLFFNILIHLPGFDNNKDLYIFYILCFFCFKTIFRVNVIKQKISIFNDLTVLFLDFPLYKI